MNIQLLGLGLHKAWDVAGAHQMLDSQVYIPCTTHLPINHRLSCALVDPVLLCFVEAVLQSG